MAENTNSRPEVEELVAKSGKALEDEELEGISGGADNGPGDLDDYPYTPCPKSSNGRHNFVASRQGTMCMNCMQWEGLVRKK